MSEDKKPEKVGRKRLDEKNSVFSLSISPDDRRDFEAIAGALGLSKSDFFRTIWQEFKEMQFLKTDKDFQDLRQKLIAKKK